MKIKLVSYNIHSGVGIDGTFSYGRIGEFLATLSPDFVCLQEMDLRNPALSKQSEIDALKAGYFEHFIPCPAVRTNSGYYGNAILSRHAPLQTNRVEIGVEGKQPRNIQQANFAIKGKQLALINSHFGLKAKERQYQFSKLIEHLKQIQNPDKDNAIVVGDFNEWRPVSKSVNNMRSVMTPIHLNATFPNRAPLFKLDKAWCGKNVSCKQADVLKTPETRVYSDHFPIKLECELVD